MLCDVHIFGDDLTCGWWLRGFGRASIETVSARLHAALYANVGASNNMKLLSTRKQKQQTDDFPRLAKAL